ncbi:MAG: phosphoglucosamine mutase [Anaerolineae bacterium]
MTQRITFGTDGIRGIAGEFPLDVESVKQIGIAIGQWLREQQGIRQRVVMGMDTRNSGTWIARALADGILPEGIDVYVVDVITTPGICYITRTYDFGLGIMISASHNPAEQNGIKLFGADGFKLDDTQEEQIEALANHESYPHIAVVDKRGEYHGFNENNTPNLPRAYRDHLVADLPANALSDLKVVLDCAHGAAYKIAYFVFRDQTEHTITLNDEPDGDNINVRAGSEFVRRDRQPLIDAIRANNADLGIAFDGDADRVVFVTPDGMLIDGDHVLGILAVEMKRQGKLPGDTVVATEMSNSGLEDYLNRHGITLSRTKVGDRYVMERMRQGGFSLGGEQAGHIIILDADHTCGDGIYAGLQVAALVAANKRSGGASLSEMARQIVRYPQVIASAHLRDRVDLKTLPALEELQQAALASFGGKGRINMRFSGTEPNLLRVMVEGSAGTTMQQVIDQALTLCAPVIKATDSVNPKIDMVDCVTGEAIKL